MKDLPSVPKQSRRSSVGKSVSPVRIRSEVRLLSAAPTESTHTMNRRQFLKRTAQGTAALGAAALVGSFMDEFAEDEAETVEPDLVTGSMTVETTERRDDPGVWDDGQGNTSSGWERPRLVDVTAMGDLHRRYEVWYPRGTDAG